MFLCGDTLISQVVTPDPDLVASNVSYVDRLAGKTEIPVTFGLIPSAAEVWKDKLPAGAQSWDQTALLAQSDVDFNAALSAHADKPIFYRTDHHWTTLGAFYGANSILEAMELPTLNKEDFTPETVSRCRATRVMRWPPGSPGSRFSSMAIPIPSFLSVYGSGLSLCGERGK